MDTHLRGLEILRWAHGGDGVAVPASGPLAGRVVFVPGAVPGDVVTVRVVRRKRRWARAAIVAIERPSAWRREPACRHVDACGGCPWMRGAPEAQAASRLAILQGEARKALGWDDGRVADRVRLAPPAGPEVGYRNRARMAWHRDAATGALALGYRGAGSHRIVDVDTCAVVDPAIAARMPAWRAQIEAQGGADGSVQVVAGEGGVAARLIPTRGEAWRDGPGDVSLDLGAWSVRATPEGFAQANPWVAGAIARRVEEIAVQLGGGRAVELFAGSGTLTPALSRAGYRVAAYEVSTEACAELRRTVGAWIEDPGVVVHATDLLATGVPVPAPGPVDLVLLDPPRTGAAPLMPWIAASGASAVILVSCDVATGLRDLAALTARGWVVRWIEGHDMFPQTGHQEVLALAEAPGG